jgi:SAM-dependent methyltransferase
MLEPYEHALEETAKATFGEYVLDVGCGFGTTTLAMARAVGEQGRVVGYDLSEAMVERVRSRAEALEFTNVVLAVGDAQTDPLPSDEFHLVVSRMGVMFFDDPVEAFTNVRQSLRQDGRLAFVCWQRLTDNEFGYAIATTLAPLVGRQDAPAPGPGPFAFGDPDRVRDILTKAGFTGVVLEPFAAPVVLGGGEGLDAAVDHYAGTGEARRILGRLDDEQRQKAVTLVRDMLAAHLVDGKVMLGSAAWIVTAQA